MIEDLNPYAAAWKSNHAPRLNLRPSKWIAANVYLTDSPIAAKYQDGGHCDAILDALADPDVYEICGVCHTGAGKSAILEGASCWIVDQAPGPTLLLGQTNETTPHWMETRMKVAFKRCEATSKMIPKEKDRHKDRKDAIIFPHMQYLTGGANLTNTQEVSMRYTLGDEAWVWKHGIIGELLKRHHDRWNRKSLIVSQGGVEGGDWETHAKNGLGFDRGFDCPECGHEQAFQWSQVKFEEIRTGNNEPDWPEIFKSVFYECAQCEFKFEDSASGRHYMTSRAKYICRHNSHIPGRVTYYVPAMANPRIQLRTLVQEWIQAQDALKNADKEPLKQFIMKRLAQFWVEKPEVPNLDTGSDPYQKSQYNAGEKWEIEHARFMSIDVQKGHFWVAIRAWAIAPLRSRLLWEGRVDTWQTLFELQERFGLENRNVFIDGRYSIDEVIRQIYEKCGPKIENHWNVLIGQDNSKGYPFDVGTPKRPRKVWKIYSKYQNNMTSRGQKYRTISFSNLRAKDALSQIMELGDGAFGVPVDASKHYVAQMQSETKKEIKPGLWKWDKIKPHYQNHLWDCEVMGLVACSIRGVVKIESEDG